MTRSWGDILTFTSLSTFLFTFGGSAAFLRHMTGGKCAQHFWEWGARAFSLLLGIFFGIEKLLIVKMDTDKNWKGVSIY